MTIRSISFACVAAAALAGAAMAQEAEDPPMPAPPGSDLSLGEEVMDDGFGEAYLAEVHGDWEQRCIRVPDGSDPCQLYQLLRDAEGNSVAEISMFPLPPGGEAVAGASIITPLETLLTQQITMRVDGGAAKRYPFTWCSAIGCIARVGFTNAEVEAFRRGAQAILTIVPVVAPDQQVDLTMSLIGFTAGFAAVTEANQP